MGGVYYLHVKAVDFAGNETIVIKKIKVNALTEIIGKVVPTNDYGHTIYNRTVNGDRNVYVVKNTAYNTKYTLCISVLVK